MVSLWVAALGVASQKGQKKLVKRIKQSKPHLQSTCKVVLFTCPGVLLSPIPVYSPK